MANPSGAAPFELGGRPETLKPEGVPAVPLLLQLKIRNAEWVKLMSPDPKSCRLQPVPSAGVVFSGPPMGTEGSSAVKNSFHRPLFSVSIRRNGLMS